MGDTSAISPRGEGFGASADVALSNSIVDLTAAPGHALAICAMGSKLADAPSQWADSLK